MRNKAELFFNLFFPLLFLLIFGNMQKGASDYRKTWLGVYLSGTEQVETVIRDSGIWELRNYETEAELVQAIQTGKINLGLAYDGKHARFFHKEGDPGAQTKMLLAQFSITTALQRHANQVNPVIRVSRNEISAGKMLATGLDYTLSGIISIAILSVGMLSVVSMFGRYRKSGVLKQLRIAPLRPVSFVTGLTFTRLILSFISIFLILATSLLVLQASFQINWPLFTLTIICSTMGMMALGLILNLVFRNTETANTAAGILMFVMYFLAGVFFPTALLPGYMKLLSALLPLKYVSQLVRHSLGIELLSGWNFALICAGLALGGILMLWWAGKSFLRANHQ
jgi:ABC-2 type transport system permease protein